MAPTPTAVGGLLRQVIHYHLDNASYDNALFFAERYTTQDPRSADATHLYALCHLRQRDYRSAYDVSKPLGLRGISLGCAWVFAHACLALDRHKEGITALEKARGHWSQKNSMGKHTATSRASLPDASAVLSLLGKLHRGYGDKKKAISCFEDALKINPFMWDAFTALCDMGIHVRVPNIFKPSDFLQQSFDMEIPQGAVAEMRENITQSHPSDVITKKASIRNMVADLGTDPFSADAMVPESTNASTDSLSDQIHNDFMSKIQNARLRLATAANSSPIMDGMETPPGLSAEPPSSHAVISQDAPQAPTRRARPTQQAEQGLEGPPRMNYRLGARRGVRAQERGQDQTAELVTDAPAVGASAAGRAAVVSATERKRTLSGHPVLRSTNADEQATRRSARLNMFKPSTRVNTGAATVGASAGRELKKARPPISRIIRPGSSGSNVGRVVSGNRKPLEDHQVDTDHAETSRAREAPSQPVAAKPPPSDQAEALKLEEALKWALDLMKKLGSGYYFLSRFQCQEALQSLTSLPSSHQGSPWVLALMGRAHYEQASYVEAETFFRRMRVQAPSRLQDMEVYSTILWHLKRETDLSFLAHELVDAAWHSPQAWCAVGNAWSLARDPEQALRCFKRATQLDPKFAYAFTLQGHEHVTNEEYEKALTAYRQAISADRRHYNAYYGIGRVQERLGAYDKAFVHYHAAQTINPNNAVLICCIGTVLEKQKKMVPALQAYSKAAELAPRAGQTRYRKARALMAVGQLEAAQNELMILKDLVPNESTVHFLIGSLYRSMNDRQQAVRHFTNALALDPKSAPQIKSAIESFEDDIPMDDSMMA